MEHYAPVATQQSTFYCSHGFNLARFAQEFILNNHTCPNVRMLLDLDVSRQMNASKETNTATPDQFHFQCVFNVEPGSCQPCPSFRRAPLAFMRSAVDK